MLTVTFARGNIWSRQAAHSCAELVTKREGGLVVAGFCRSRDSCVFTHTLVSPGTGPVTRDVRALALGILTGTPPLSTPKASGNCWSSVPET